MYHEQRWTLEKIKRRIELIAPLVYRNRRLVPPFRYEPLPDAAAFPHPGQPLGPDAAVIEYNMYWGAHHTNFIMQTTFEAPADWDAGGALALFLPLGDAHDFSHPETLVYVDGEPLAANDRHHQEVRLPAQYHDGQTHSLTLHGWTGALSEDRPKLLLRPCQVVQIDQPTRDLVVRARVALETAAVLDENSYERARLLNALDAAFKRLDTREPFGGAFYDSVPAAYRALTEGIEQAGEPLKAHLVAAGHAHIDVAWLWTLGQVRRKTARTFSTVLHYMETFERYHFTQSQPQLYEFIRQDHPQMFEQIKQRVREGRWEPIGGMWVEADCNIPGGESLARQFVLGRTFFDKHFGKGADTPVLWLPDVFGYNGALPQLMKQAGVDYFFTTKISWNQYNAMPYDSFWWQGIDGTKVLTHFTTTPEQRDLTGTFRTYNADASPAAVLYSWRNLQHKEHQRTLLMSYGYGDGGGGPTREMLENIREMARFPGLPQTRHDKVGNFFKTLEAEAGESLPTWNGELYFELHRGTYTTQARLKRANRRSEFMLHDAEFLAALAAQLDAAYAYPREALWRAWELVCVNQFHDIIPGTSITPVYPEALAHHAEVQSTAAGVCEAALKTIGGRLGGDVLVVNPTSFARSDLALWRDAPEDAAGLKAAGGQVIPGQRTGEGVLFAVEDLAPYSVQGYSLLREAAPPPTGLTASEAHLENDHVRVEFDPNGDITRIYDKRRAREVLPQGAVANQFQLFEDRPQNWDAWDIDIHYTDRVWLAEPAASVTVEAAGPLRATLRVERRIHNSTYTQRISLDYNSPLVRFDTRIDWQERHMLLKVAFPVEVLASAATYEIQWGSLQRPTHWNTSWDWARFEVCAQKWVDLSEGGYGVSLLNDCKYGHDIKDNVIRLTLLRAPTNPDPTADVGEHAFSYALLPHAGDWRGGTIPAAYHMNNPTLVAAKAGPNTGELPAVQLASVDAENVVIETVKQAEDGRGVILRLYESQQERGAVRLQTTAPIKATWRCDLLETDKEQIAAVDGNTLTLHVRPFEIQTIRLVF